MVRYDMAKVTAEEIKKAQENGEEIIIRCVECGEKTHPEFYNETIRICDGCGKVWEIK